MDVYKIGSTELKKAQRSILKAVLSCISQTPTIAAKSQSQPEIVLELACHIYLDKQLFFLLKSQTRAIT